MASHTQKTNSKPSYVANLEVAYDAPSQDGFGSAVLSLPRTWIPQRIENIRRSQSTNTSSATSGAPGRRRLDGAVERGLCAPSGLKQRNPPSGQGLTPVRWRGQSTELVLGEPRGDPCAAATNQSPPDQGESLAMTEFVTVLARAVRPMAADLNNLDEKTPALKHPFLLKNSSLFSMRLA